MAVITPQKIQKKLLVRQGDNWFNLAERYGVSPTDLANANGDVKKLLPGQTVVIPTADSLLRSLAKGKRGAPPKPGQDNAGERREAGASSFAPAQTPKKNGVTPVLSWTSKGLPGGSANYTPPAQPAQPTPQLGVVGMPGGTTPEQARNAVNNFMAKQNPTPRPGTPTQAATQPPAAPGAAAPKSPAAQQVLANIAAAKAKPGAFNMTDQQRVAEEWKVIFPGQPVPTFSQSFLLRLANADNAADYQRILANWSSSAGGVGAKDLITILNKALNDPTYPWPKAIMPWEIAKYNIPEDTINQLYVYDPKLGYWVIRTNVQGAPPVSGGGGGGGGAAAPENSGFTGGTGAPGRGNGGGYGNNNNQNGAGGLGLINWRF